MARGFSVGAVRRIAGQGKHIAAVTVTAGIMLLGLAETGAAETNGGPLIRIPPARVPPLAAAPAANPAANPVAPGKIAPAARSLLPTDVQVLRDSRGAGLAMYGALTGKAGSAIGVVLAVFACSGAFDPGRGVAAGGGG